MYDDTSGTKRDKTYEVSTTVSPGRSLHLQNDVIDSPVFRSCSVLVLKSTVYRLYFAKAVGADSKRRIENREGGG